MIFRSHLYNGRSILGLAENNFSQEKMVNDHLKVYEDILK